MEEDEKRGFTVRDRRKVSLDDSGQEAAQPEVGNPDADEIKKSEFEEASRTRDDRGRAPLPEVNLSTFVLSLSSSALMSLGEIPEPESQIVRVDLPIAKQIIDTLGMLQKKTRGNLDPDEERLLTGILSDLRMRYVQKSSKKPA